MHNCKKWHGSWILKCFIIKKGIRLRLDLAIPDSQTFYIYQLNISSVFADFMISETAFIWCKIVSKIPHHCERNWIIKQERNTHMMDKKNWLNNFYQISVNLSGNTYTILFTELFIFYYNIWREKKIGDITKYTIRNFTFRHSNN